MPEAPRPLDAGTLLLVDKGVYPGDSPEEFQEFIHKCIRELGGTAPRVLSLDKSTPKGLRTLSAREWRAVDNLAIPEWQHLVMAAARGLPSGDSDREYLASVADEIDRFLHSLDRRTGLTVVQYEVDWVPEGFGSRLILDVREYEETLVPGLRKEWAQISDEKAKGWVAYLRRTTYDADSLER